MHQQQAANSHTCTSDRKPHAHTTFHFYDLKMHLKGCYIPRHIHSCNYPSWYRVSLTEKPYHLCQKCWITGFLNPWVSEHLVWLSLSSRSRAMIIAVCNLHSPSTRTSGAFPSRDTESQPKPLNGCLWGRAVSYPTTTTTITTTFIPSSNLTVNATNKW